jgi:hypothetical protein
MNQMIAFARIFRQAHQSSGNLTPISAERQKIPEVSANSLEEIPNLHFPQRKLKTPPPLFNLSNELIHDIATWLPPSAAAAFTLCSRRLSFVIGTRYLQICNELGHEEERKTLLDLFSRDLEDHIHCHRCRKVHKAELQPNMTRKCTISDYDDLSKILFQGFLFINLQMAMKLHRLGKDPGLHLRFLTKSNQISRRIGGDRSEPYITYESRIVGRDVLFRSQFCLFIPRHSIDIRAILHHIATHRLRKFNICRHYQLYDIGIRAIFLCLMEHLAKGTPFCSCMGLMDLTECRKCGTEFKMDLMDYADKGVVFIVTKWVDLGPGLSPEDEKWRRLIELDYQSMPGWRPSTCRVMPLFEDCEPSDFEAVLSAAQKASLFPVEK